MKYSKHISKAKQNRNFPKRMKKDFIYYTKNN